MVQFKILGQEIKLPENFNVSFSSNNPIFNFESSELRSFIDEFGEAWFVGKDVAEILGYANENEKCLQELNQLNPGYTELCKTYADKVRDYEEVRRNLISKYHIFAANSSMYYIIYLFFVVVLVVCFTRRKK